MLGEHAQEPFDRTWAPAEEQSIRRSLASSTEQANAQLKEVDCRSKTCTATITFATPVEGLSYAQSASPGMRVEGCRGAVAIPRPPQTQGAYELTVVFNCRE